MLLVADSMKELNFPQLMQVYLEGNLENAEDQWPEESEGRRLQLAEESFRQYLQDDFFRIPGAVYFIWQENGVYVSALRLEPYRDGWLLEALETAPEHRRKGYAEKLMRQVLEQEGYAIVYSHVHKKNVPSLKLHEKCGFRRISEQAAYIDGSVNSHACTMCRTR